MVVVSEPNKSEVGDQKGAFVPVVALGVFYLIDRIDYELALPRL